MKKKQINAELGADIVINHYTEDVEKRVREIFNEGVDNSNRSCRKSDV
ncbi:MAG: hypothetical protein QXL69_05340 [Candidatus Bathyarchaeia archaeon]